MARYRLLRLNGVHDNDEGVDIPDNDANKDWRKYQEWLNAGNSPDAYVPPPPPADADRVESISRGDWAALFEAVRDIDNRIRAIELKAVQSQDEFKTWIATFLPRG